MISFILTELIFAQDTVILKKNLPLLNGTINTASKLIEITKMNYEFDGYLIVQLEKNKITQSDTITYSCPVFWINSLNNLNNEYQYFQNFTLFSFAFKSNTFEINKNNKGREILDFIKFYINFNEANREYFTTYLYDSLLTTDILDNSIIWVYQDRYFIIFKTRFDTSIMKIKTPKLLNNKYTYINWNIFIPISKLKYFSKLEDSEPLPFGMKMSGLLKTR